jgi:large subunit ribosomal protein L21
MLAASYGPWGFIPDLREFSCPEGALLYAIIRSGGKQYRVAENSIVSVEKLDAEDGSTVELTDVLMIGDGDKIKIGEPLVDGAKVTATVLNTEKGKKIKGFIFKKTKSYHRRYGHRQWHTRIKVESITH